MLFLLPNPLLLKKRLMSNSSLAAGFFDLRDEFF